MTSVLAMLLIVGGNIGVLTLGLAAWSRPGWRARGAWALVAGATGTAATILFSGNQFVGLGLGAMERLAVYPLVVWAIDTGLGWIGATRQR